MAFQHAARELRAEAHRARLVEKCVSYYQSWVDSENWPRPGDPPSKFPLCLMRLPFGVLQETARQLQELRERPRPPFRGPS